ncbi:hypothetical protein Tco_0246965 [Tanacetum coccineum]
MWHFRVTSDNNSRASEFSYSTKMCRLWGDLVSLECTAVWLRERVTSLRWVTHFGSVVRISPDFGRLDFFCTPWYRGVNGDIWVRKFRSSTAGKSGGAQLGIDSELEACVGDGECWKWHGGDGVSLNMVHWVEVWVNFSEDSRYTILCIDMRHATLIRCIADGSIGDCICIREGWWMETIEVRYGRVIGVGCEWWSESGSTILLELANCDESRSWKRSRSEMTIIDVLISVGRCEHAETEVVSHGLSSIGWNWGDVSIWHSGTSHWVRDELRGKDNKEIVMNI